MKFRPCIDIHNGQVKQIVGGSLTDDKDFATENFVAKADASFYANMYKSNNIVGGHIIILNAKDSDYYEATKKQAFLALKTYPAGLQIGGGIDSSNALEYINAGATHVIVTSYVFKDGRINYENLERISETVGKDKLVIDLSCRKKDGKYYVVTDRWQKFTDVAVCKELFYELYKYCDEFLVHAVDVEGKANGIEADVVAILGELEGIKVTYAGGISSYEDIELLKKLGNNKVDFTVGSALDIFGGNLEYKKIVEIGREE